MSEETAGIRACAANCFTCAFQYMANHGKTPYCTLHNMPLLNPEVGCSRRMLKAEFKGKNKSKATQTITQEEFAAFEVAKDKKRFEI